MKRFFLLLLAAIIGLLPLMSACAEAPLDGYPGIDELPAIDTINNPFEFFDVKNDPNGDGIVTDITEWEARRTEIRDLIQHYWLGYRWETAAEDVSGKYEIVYEDNTASYGGFYGIWGACVFNLGASVGTFSFAAKLAFAPVSGFVMVMTAILFYLLKGGLYFTDSISIPRPRLLFP